ncbi:Acriflavin resistance protein [Acididesulfobacillus acetoxydans]|uniref:Acriflavin resistance protein n=1 Tax=Acididesulfobacillus acetoxydans TaxID=1561005 RepID=A0A8S0XZW1_9FIRM|nr:efflux RND transporter permease subunit [Acididesulfobacillus acetoxydans]CAA7602597.1 Acriflavin resistance protein [Acididesulfobacillus acetoxydans]CEJ07256.1 Nodulation protein NolG [Acididesulfobacillus acetoxydans]
MKIADLSIRRPVTISMIMLAAMLLGAVAMFGLPQDLYPELSWPTASIVTTYPGGSPVIIEQQVTKPIEDSLQSLSGVEQVTSSSLPNVSTITVQFKYGVDLNAKIENIRGYINSISNTLPADAKAPIVKEFNPSDLPIMTLALSGSQSLEVLSSLADNLVYPTLQHLSGVGQVDEIGNLKREIHIDVDPNKLDYYHLGIQQVAQAIQSDNISVDVGQVNQNKNLIPLNISGQFTSPQELLAVPITVGSTTLTVRDVATVKDSFADITLVSRLDNKPSIGFSIKQASGGNTVKVSDEVRKTVASLQDQLPQGVHLTVVSDNAQTIRETVKVVSEHTLWGFLLGVLFMLGILRSFRTTLVIAFAIPIAVLSTFILMYFFHLTINTITLGSLAIALGSLVDFSVVVLESIFRARQSGLDSKTAASQGTQEVGMAVMVAALAQISVFGPALFTGGIAGQIFAPMSLVVVFAHLVAVIVALTLTPMLASRFLAGSRFAQEESIPGLNAPFRLWAPFDWFARGMHWLTQGYRRLLAWSLSHRLTVVLLSLLLVVSVLPLIPLIGSEMMPAVNTGQINVDITCPAGYNIKDTERTAKTVEERIRTGIQGVTSIYTQVGGVTGVDTGGAEIAKMTVTLAPEQRTNVTKDAYLVQKLTSALPGVKTTAKPASALRGPETGTVEVVLTGPDMNTLALLSSQVTDILQKVPGLSYIDNQLSSGIPAYKLSIDHNALAANGLSEQQVISTLYNYNHGATVSTFYEGNNSYDIILKTPGKFSREVSQVLDAEVMNNKGQLIALSQVASLKLSQQPTVINHENGLRAVHIKAGVRGVSVGEAEKTIQTKLMALHLPKGYKLIQAAARYFRKMLSKPLEVVS